MQTNFIHQKQKISLSGKNLLFFPLWKNVNTQDKICSSSEQVMHSSAVCNLFSKRWSGSICEHLRGKAGFGETLKYVGSSSSSMKHSITKKSQKTVNKNMSWIFFFPIDIQLWWMTQEVNNCRSCVSKIANRCIQSWVTESEAGKMNTTEGLCQCKYRPYIKPQENWTGFCCTFCFGLGCASMGLFPFLMLCLGIGASLGREEFT